jgi:hypothetical protein
LHPVYLTPLCQWIRVHFLHRSIPSFPLFINLFFSSSSTFSFFFLITTQSNNWRFLSKDDQSFWHSKFRR